MLRATTACTFSTSQLPKVVREWRVLPLFTSKCASRHNGVQFFLSHLPRRLRTRRFSEPTFRPSGATKHWKNTMFRDFPTFSRTCIFSLLTFFISELLLLWTAFSFLHIVGSLASKLPSTIYYYYYYDCYYYYYYYCYYYCILLYTGYLLLSATTTTYYCYYYYYYCYYYYYYYVVPHKAVAEVSK